MNWVILLLYLYIAYYTFSYAIAIWREGKKFATMVIGVLALSIVALPIWVLFYK